MKKVVLKSEIEMAGQHYGMDMSRLPVRQQQILTVIYFYREGWIDEKSLEDKLEKIFK